LELLFTVLFQQQKVHFVIVTDR